MELDIKMLKLMLEIVCIIYCGIVVVLVEGLYFYKLNGYYYLFVVQGGIVFIYQEVVVWLKIFEVDSFEIELGDVFLINVDILDSYIQKQGYGVLVFILEGEWYYVLFCVWLWNCLGEFIYDLCGWLIFGWEIVIQKVYWDDEGWLCIEGGYGGKIFVEGLKDVIFIESVSDNSQQDDFILLVFDLNWNILWVLFMVKMGIIGDGKLILIGQGLLVNMYDLLLIVCCWQVFYFDVVVKVKFEFFSYQQMVGLMNYYNDCYWSFVFLIWNEINGKVIEVGENNCGKYMLYLKDNVIKVLDGVEYVWFWIKVCKQIYSYEYSFDGVMFIEILVQLDVVVLFDDYVLQSYGGFFIGVFVGLVVVDYVGYGIQVEFYQFEYQELGDRLVVDGSYSWEVGEMWDK